MQVSPSKAEIDVRIEVQKRGLHRKMLPMETVVIFDSHNGKPYIHIVAHDRLTKIMLQRGGTRLPFTVPDLLFGKGIDPIVPVYLDGQPHEKAGVMNRDQKINQLWAERGIVPLRFPYKAPLSDVRKMEIVDVIEKELQK